MVQSVMKTFTKLGARVSDNTAQRITAHRGAADCRGHNSKFDGGVKNTAEAVVTDITLDDRQAGCLPGKKTIVADPVGRVAA
jgi:hypothetical protein